MKIFSVGPTEFLIWELKFIEQMEIDWFVYCYSEGSYEGSGFAIWKNGKKYHYANLGHCSCNGPTDDLRDTIPYDSLAEIQKIIKNYGSDASTVMKFIKSKRWK